jgi:hypothetical protein
VTEALIRYEEPAAHVARIVLTRVEKHNSINPQMIFEVNDAFSRALYDDQIKVIILAADGKHFSAISPIRLRIIRLGSRRKSAKWGIGAAFRSRVRMAGTPPRKKRISKRQGDGAIFQSRRFARCRVNALPAR